MSFLKKTLGVKIKKIPGGKFKKTQGANLKKAWGVFLWVFFEKPPGFCHNLIKINSEPLIHSSFIIHSEIWAQYTQLYT